MSHLGRLLAVIGCAAWAATPTGCSSDGSSGTFVPDAGANDGAAGDVSTGDSSTGGSAGTGTDSGGAAGSGGMAGESICGNGLDDDDDGEVDEGCPCEVGEQQPCYGGPASQAEVGLCALGTQICQPVTPTAASWGDCFGWTEPSDEMCNDQDDDCDGEVDEDLVHFCTEGGQTTCTAGEWSPCEECNGSDDDGDGQFDEDLLRGCTERCDGVGFQTCESTTWTACVPGRTFDPGIDRGGIELDAVSIASDQSVLSLTFSHTTSASISDRLLLVGVALDSPASINSVTYGGSSLTEVASWTADSGFDELRVEVYYLVDPPAGAADVVINLAETRNINAGVYSMGNVAGPPKLIGASKERSTDPKHDAIATPAGLVVDFIAKEANHEISPAPINELGWDFCGPGYSRFGSSIRAADGPTTLFWEFSCCSDQWILGGVLVNPK